MHAMMNAGEQNGKGLEHLAFLLHEVKPAKLAHARSLGCSVLVNYFEPWRLEGKSSATKHGPRAAV